MTLLSKTVCATLFILSFCSFLQAQISLDKLAYQTNSNLVEELHFQYENGLVSHIDAFSDVDTSHLSIEYENARYSAIHCISTDGYPDNFSLSFLYNNDRIDTIFFVDDQTIGLFVFHYTGANFLTTIDRFVNKEGELFHSNRTNFQYENAKCVRKEVVDFYNEAQDDYNANIDDYSYDAQNQLSEIDHTYGGSMGYSKSSFEYLNSDLVDKTIRYFNGGDEIVSEYEFNPSYSQSFLMDDIDNPFELMDLLRNIDMFSYHNLIEPHIFTRTGKAILEIDKSATPFCTFEYSESLISEIEEVEKTSDSPIIYPNPVSDYLYFSDGFDAELVSIFDMQGALVCKMNYQNSNVNLVNLKRGNYLLNAVDSEGKAISIQFVKI